MIPTTNKLFQESGNKLGDDCESEYTLHDGTLLMPVMGDSSQQPVVVRIHPPYTTREARFQFTQSKMPPLIPPPGDTTPNGVNSASGDTYLGGAFTLPAPKANANHDLVYIVKGHYNFLVANDVRMYGKVRFDAHIYRSMVDLLGYITAPDDETWVSPYYNLNELASSRILG